MYTHFRVELIHLYIKYRTVSLNLKKVKTIIKLLNDIIDLYCFKTYDLKPRWVNEFIKESREIIII